MVLKGLLTRKKEKIIIIFTNDSNDSIYILLKLIL
jgi:hypothetical protein